ncbi:unnamed protein product [Adineta ricciae]|uniref:Ion transport domain-containing protein n=1 Tax=Adineta ricciae TaxID=249248 RepID=A0A815JH84_ADIRI|nr:unnamed protein product [Adineta ricciae]
MVSIKHFDNDSFETTNFDEECSSHIDDHKIHECISILSSSGNTNEQINDLLGLSSLLSQQTSSNEFISSESRLIRSKIQRLFHFLANDAYKESVAQAEGDRISNLVQVDHTLIELGRNATLKFRNYKQLREQLLASTIVRTAEQHEMNLKPTTISSISPYNPLKHYVHWLVQSSFFKWFISLIICLDAVRLTVEYSSPNDSQTMIYRLAVLINRFILFIYLFELIFKWIDNFTNFWYSPVNILEFILTATSLLNLISEVYIDTTDDTSSHLDRRFRNNNDPTPANTLQRIRSYGSILSLFRTLRMLRILRILEVAFRFTQVRIVFIALSRSVKLIFHVVLLTIIINYFFALIALYLTQFGLNTTSEEHLSKINSLFGTVPRAFITVFRLFTKDEWYEIKLEMYSLRINRFIIDLYVISWLFFGGYVLNPLLIGAMVGTFDETRKELTEGVKHIISKTGLPLPEIDSLENQSFSAFLNRISSVDNDHDRFDEWLHLTSDEIRLLTQDRIETRWPIYTAFYYLQLLEIYFENVVERQLLFDFISIYLLTLHDKEIKSLNPPILSSSSDDDDD